jgi:hypothetical protein
MMLIVDGWKDISRKQISHYSRITIISWVAYAVEESASDAKTAKPIALPIDWWGASAVDKGCPISQWLRERGGLKPVVRRMIEVWLSSSEVNIRPYFI